MPTNIDQQQNFLGIDAPARRMFSIVPDDNNDLALSTRGVYIGGAGNLHVVTTEGDNETAVGLLGGSVYPFRVRRVLSTGTTATNIMGLA